MALLDVKDLQVHYKTKQGASRAVDGVSFSVNKGESLGLVGESGCGKSTTVNGIVRVMPKNAYLPGGEVWLNGTNLAELPEKQMQAVRWKEVSLIPQAAMDSLNPVYPTQDAFLEVLMLKGGLTKAQALERSEELFLMVGLDVKRLRNFPHEFSGGMKQRAAIALALALNPKLVIADEPVTALDVIVQRQVLNELRKLRNKLGISLIMITHDISVVAESCQKIAVMYAGKIVECGLTEDVLSNPLHPYTMGLKNAFPDLRDKNKKLISIKGAPPSLVDPPPGCRFADRCPFALKECSKVEPQPAEVHPNHLSACLRLEEVDKLQREAQEVTTW